MPQHTTSLDTDVSQEDLTKVKAELDALKKAHAPCPDIIAGLKKDLEAAKAEHEPCAAQIKELKAHLARLDKELHAELEKEEALAKELAEEKRKEAELEQSLQKTKADLEKDERDLAEDKKVRARGAGWSMACSSVLERRRQASDSPGQECEQGRRTDGMGGWGMAGVCEQGRRDCGSEEAAQGAAG